MSLRVARMCRSVPPSRRAEAGNHLSLMELLDRLVPQLLGSFSLLPREVAVDQLLGLCQGHVSASSQGLDGRDRIKLVILDEGSSDLFWRFPCVKRRSDKLVWLHP